MERGQINPILAEKLLVKEENRNFISEFVEPLLITIFLYVNCFKDHLNTQRQSIFWLVPEVEYFGKIDFTKFFQGVITEGAVILGMPCDFDSGIL